MNHTSYAPNLGAIRASDPLVDEALTTMKALHVAVADSARPRGLAADYRAIADRLRAAAAALASGSASVHATLRLQRRERARDLVIECETLLAFLVDREAVDRDSVAGWAKAAAALAAQLATVCTQTARATMVNRHRTASLPKPRRSHRPHRGGANALPPAARAGDAGDRGSLEVHVLPLEAGGVDDGEPVEHIETPAHDADGGHGLGGDRDHDP
jgi:hypothetical protein